MKIKGILSLIAIGLISLIQACGGEKESPVADRVELQIFRDRQGQPSDTLTYSFSNADTVSLFADHLDTPGQMGQSCLRYGSFELYSGDSIIRSLRFSLGAGNCNLVLEELADSAGIYGMDPDLQALLHSLGPEKTEADFDNYVGTWVREEENAHSFEEWRADGENYRGSAGTVAHSGDTLYFEKLRILKDEGEWYYEADVPENEAPVRFKLTRWEPSRAMFENPEHDFPQTLIYRQYGDSLHARIEGMVNQMLQGRDFYFKKRLPNP